jgi:hypothetical protein
LPVFGQKMKGNPDKKGHEHGRGVVALRYELRSYGKGDGNR